MTPYMNRNDNSNIEAYEIDGDSITVKFMSGRWQYYLYTSQKPGPIVVEKMQDLAREGRGLNSYISRVVRTNFERKW
ncbi:hypothetical protein GLP21_10380 [Photobacterium carnosum]|uniref:hypothetical protein n=1 Tax=Photobacterium carnosum TaxID=2023717 RepID=UPI001E35D286|nr:hypothetical protein [Photobacterium carnosum]MCD9521553.1 hypothetical protein [Photobacterium carnosum]MCD9549036.1 hypothetical protein [Photobacterium carnosum]MCF2305975.1 hypothetical protein [Photobacterium carnosum]